MTSSGPVRSYYIGEEKLTPIFDVTGLSFSVP